MKVSACRICASTDLTQFLDLGAMPPADSFLSAEAVEQVEISYPLKVAVCGNCGLVQLTFVVDPEILYCHDYPYEASITKLGRQHWQEFARTVCEMCKLSSKDLVIDVGSNVGILLEMFRQNGPRVLGIDPAANIVQIANSNGIPTWVGFFNLEIAQRIVSEHGQVSVMTGTNVFAHVDDLSAFMKAVDVVLKPDGILIIEAPYLGELLRNVEYDTIYHEHLSYIAVKPLTFLFDRFGMEIFNVQRRDIHGGSFRVFVQRQGTGPHPVSDVIDEMLAIEEREGLADINRLRQFADAVTKNREEVQWLLHRLKREGKRIAAVSAPAKGMTLLNYCRLGPEILDFATEKSKLKIGRYTPGMHIPIFGDDHLLKEQPDYALILAWNFAEEIMNNLREFSDKGGRFIVPIPYPRIIG